MAVLTLVRQFRLHVRLLTAVTVAIAGWLLLSGIPMQASTRLIAALDMGGMVFLGLAWTMMTRAPPQRMRMRARLQDEGKFTILVLTVGAAAFSLFSVALELHGIKDLPAARLLIHLGLAISTIVCTWLVTHTMFALHYAHAYYGDGKTGGEPARGIDFPGCEHPDYWDFLYFAFVIAMTCQTSDVAISGRGIRRLSLAQGVLSFFYNTVILALSINIAAGLL